MVDDIFCLYLSRNNIYKIFCINNNKYRYWRGSLPKRKAGEGGKLSIFGLFPSHILNYKQVVK